MYRSVDESVQQVVKPWDGYWTRFSYEGDLDSPWQLYSKDYPSQFVFVTDESYNGNLGGIAGADEICQQAAEDAGYPGDYKAWLSAGSSPSTSFSNPESPYIRTDGALIADGWDDLVTFNSGSFIDNPVEITPSLTGAANAVVWTNTSVDGEPLVSAPCGAWNSELAPQGAPPVVTGSTSRTNLGWTIGSVENSCSSEARLYCFGQ